MLERRGLRDVYNPPEVNRIWGIWGSDYNVPKDVFYLLKGDYRGFTVQALRMLSGPSTWIGISGLGVKYSAQQGESFRRVGIKREQRLHAGCLEPSPKLSYCGYHAKDRLQCNPLLLILKPPAGRLMLKNGNI